MNARIKNLLRNVAPPALVRALRRPAAPVIAYEGDFARWEDARGRAGGYDEASILDAVKTAALRVARGEAVYERDSVLFDHVELSWPMLAGLLWAAARNDGELRVLDFGGSLGTSYRQNKAFLDDLVAVRWGIVEQPHYVAAGREHFASETLSFFHTIAECTAALQPNVVLLGAALQYLPEPYTILQELSKTSAQVMILDRTPFSDIGEDTVTIQRVPPAIYTGSYPCWVFSRPAFESRFRSEWKSAAWFDCSEGETTTDVGLRLTYRGVVLTR
jgi:putative methyltransferase (TIGR04325 family)